MFDAVEPFLYLWCSLHFEKLEEKYLVINMSIYLLDQEGENEEDRLQEASIEIFHESKPTTPLFKPTIQFEIFLSVICDLLLSPSSRWIVCSVAEKKRISS